MKKYSNRKRLKTLNELLKNDELSIDNQSTHNVFTILTQHFTAHTIEDIADYIINYKKFLEAYNYDKHNLFFDLQDKQLTRLRFNAWFENRKPTKEEEDAAIQEDKIREKMWEEVNEDFKQKMAEELFDTLGLCPNPTKLDDEKEIKIRKWGAIE